MFNLAYSSKMTVKGIFHGNKVVSFKILFYVPHFDIRPAISDSKIKLVFIWNII
jgi:hypothetical protein